MPLLAFFFAGAFGVIVKFLVGRIIIALGIGFVSYVGIDLLLDQAKGYILSMYTGLPTDMLAILGIMHVDEAINIIISSIAAKLIVSGLCAAGGIKKLTFGGNCG